MTLMVLGSVTAAENAQTFLCTAESRIGFKFEKTSAHWDPVAFEASGKYLVGPGEDHPYIVKEAGGYFPIATCKQTPDKIGYLECEEIMDGSVFGFNFKNEVYQRIYTGYVLMPRAPLSTLEVPVKSAYFEIGQCRRTR